MSYRVETNIDEISNARTWQYALFSSTSLILANRSLLPLDDAPEGGALVTLPTERIVSAY